MRVKDELGYTAALRVMCMSDWVQGPPFETLPNSLCLMMLSFDVM
jgi:hypothetical protein